MANTQSAKKRIRTIANKTELNRVTKSKMRTAVRKTEDSISAKQKEAAVATFKTAMSLIAKTAQKGVLHKNTAARKISKLNAKIKALG